MLPGTAFTNLLDDAATHAQCARYMSITTRRVQDLPSDNLRYFRGGRQFTPCNRLRVAGTKVILTTGHPWLNPAALGVHIISVLLSRAKKEIPLPTAGRIVTAVQHPFAGRYRTIREYPCESVCLHALSMPCDTAVPVIVRRALKWPATVFRLRNLRPKLSNILTRAIPKMMALAIQEGLAIYPTLFGRALRRKAGLAPAPALTETKGDRGEIERGLKRTGRLLHVGVSFQTLATPPDACKHRGGIFNCNRRRDKHGWAPSQYVTIGA